MIENEEVKSLTLKSVIFYIALIKDKHNLNVNLVFNFSICALFFQISYFVTLIL